MPTVAQEPTGAPAAEQEQEAAAGQEAAGTDRLRVLVDQVAGSTVYITAGTDHGIAVGDTLRVARDSVGPVAGQLTVVASQPERSVLAFAGRPFSITRGSELFILRSSVALASDRGAQLIVTPSPEPPPSGRSGQASVRSQQRSSRSPGAPNVNGHVSLDFDLLQSKTTYGGADPQTVSRTYASPSLRFRTAVTQLPGGLRFDANVRLAYRHSGSTSIASPTSVRVYQASIEKSFKSLPLQLRLGRFYSPYESYSGYWDGLLARVGRAVGVGVAAGFQPNTWDEGFSSDLPKLSAFVDYRYRKGSTFYGIDASLHRLQPRENPFNHTFAGLSQRFQVGDFFLNQELRLDRDPVAGRWEVTRFELDAAALIESTVRVRVGVSRRSTYRLGNLTSLEDLGSEQDVISLPRDRALGGLTVNLGGGSIGADVTVNRDRQDQISYAYGSHFYFPVVTSARVAITGNASYWTRDGFKVLTASPGLSKSFGSLSANLRYRFYRSQSEARTALTDGRTITTHGIEGGLSVPFANRFRFSIQGQTQWGGTLASNRLFTGLSRAF